jgi:demethylmenaquinone methyltransferase/2-methoxy-6-polyprenyl-1,4-benzoquinol methylase
MNKDTHTNFGYRKVELEAKEPLVKDVFSNVAAKYDLMNNLMSFGIHHLWKDRVIQEVLDLKSSIVDVAGGTGDIGFRLHKKARKMNVAPNITIADINPEMLKLCKNKAIDSNILSGINFVECNAESLPFEDESFDCYIIAFGIRNITNIDVALKEAYRVLKPLGKFICLEFSKIDKFIIKKLYDAYSFSVVPAIGRIVASNENAYRYLVESIDLFPDQENFKSMIEEARFKNVKYNNLTFGISAIHTGYRI